MVHDLIYANSSPQALDLRCSNSLHIGPLNSQALAMNFGFFYAVGIPKRAATPQRLTELQDSSMLTHPEWHRAGLGISMLCCHGISNLTAKVLSVMIVSPIPPALPQSKDKWLVKQ